MQALQLVGLVLLFYLIGGVIDYWQSATEHHKKIPRWLLDYFLLFWLFIYSGLIPFLLIWVSSGYNLTIAKTFIGAMLIGMSLWDLVYSLLDTRQLVSPQAIYFCIKGKNYGLTKKQLYLWHLLRWITGLAILIY